jgi:hypothetical protein
MVSTYFYQGINMKFTPLAHIFRSLVTSKLQKVTDTTNLRKLLKSITTGEQHRKLYTSGLITCELIN